MRRRHPIGMVLAAVMALAGTAGAQQPPPPQQPQPGEGAATHAQVVDGARADRAALEGDVVATSYVVGPGDRLRVELWGLQELSQELEINAEGRLFVPRAGVFEAAGKTLAALRGAVEGRLHALYPRERASLTLLRPRTFLVHVTGAVARPGTYAASPMTRVSALLPQAGGALPSGSLRRVEIRRRGAAQPIIADLLRFMLLGQLEANPLVLDGDTIFVATRGLTVEIDGAVRRPGSYELVEGKTLAELLALAGGTTPQASRELPVRVSSRATGDHVRARSVALSAQEATELGDGDVVHVPQLADLQRIVVVEGAVVGPPGLAAEQHALRVGGETRADAAPREVSVPLAYVEGDGARDLLAKAGGLQPWADVRAAYITRVAPTGTRRQVPLDLASITSGAREDVRVEPGDTLVVPSRREQVMVGGAVLRPGFYQYSTDLRPRDYINMAGGPTRTGDAKGARVIGQNGPSRSIDKVDALHPGDVVTVPERKFTAAEVTSVVLIVGNIVVSAAALGVAAAGR